MRLSFLLGELGAAPASSDAEIENVTDTLENVRPGSLFVCIRGNRVNGASLAPEALKRGAAAIVSDEPTGLPGAIGVPNARLAYSELCAAFYGHPDRALTLVGVTGTNGKTTTARYLKYLLDRTGRKCAVIGTLGADTGAGERDTGFTTPGPDTFFASLREAADRGNACCVCEVSSQALAQYRVDGAEFTLGVFLNVGSDHLDYHKTVEKLVDAKCRLAALSEKMLLNADDAYCARFAAAAAGKPTFLYSCRGRLSDYAATNLRPNGFGMDFLLFNGTSVERVGVPAPGVYSVYNALAAAAAAMTLGAESKEIAPLLGTLPEVPGRAQRIEKNGVTFVVDFAHTPEALSAVLTALRPTVKGKLITVFGCGGDRDRKKRPVMGSVASSLSDTVVLTSDNPRSEPPEAILADIRRGVRKKSGVFCEPDRAAAIRLAARKAAPGDTVLVAGKGHEQYQLVNDEKRPFSDADTIRSIIM